MNQQIQVRSDSLPHYQAARDARAAGAARATPPAEATTAALFAVVDAALRHLPFEAGQHDLRTVVLDPVADQHASSRVEQRDAHIGPIGFL